MFPDSGQFRRKIYPKHIEFLDAGATYRERLFMAGNRVGKTEAGAYESTCHLTGVYPAWWKGKRFDEPTDGWAAGTTNEKTKEVVQEKLIGAEGHRGEGMIPAHLILNVQMKSGTPGAAQTIWVRHASGGISVVGLKSYEQRRIAFQGTAKQWIWLDEEPSLEIYTECLYRTATTNGIVYTTFTPLLGMSDVVKGFIEPTAETKLVKRVVQAGWEDAPHLDEKAKAELLASTPEYQKDARTKGIPQLGSGKIYPLAESDILVPRREIPAHWPRAYGLDVGWKKTAAIWGAKDPETQTVYLYHEHYRSTSEPAIHAEGVKAPGDWIPGVADPASLGSSQVDGTKLIETYRKLGLDLQPADNAVETGIFEVWQALSSGRLKVFSTLTNWISEFRKYHRDEKGRIVKADDHILDATRYFWLSGLKRMKTKPVKQHTNTPYGGQGGERSWMT